MTITLSPSTDPEPETKVRIPAGEWAVEKKLLKDMERMKLGNTWKPCHNHSELRIPLSSYHNLPSESKTDFTLCGSYPHVFYVPASLSEAYITQSAAFRGARRFKIILITF